MPGPLEDAGHSGCIAFRKTEASLRTPKRRPMAALQIAASKGTIVPGSGTGVAAAGDPATPGALPTPAKASVAPEPTVRLAPLGKTWGLSR